jgi:hypothetical protein
MIAGFDLATVLDGTATGHDADRVQRATNAWTPREDVFRVSYCCGAGVLSL